MPRHPDFLVSRRNFSRGLLGALTVPGILSAVGETPAQASPKNKGDADELFAQLDEKIQLGMKEFAIPGAAVGVIYNGQEFVKCYGFTDVRHPDLQHAVDPNTSFIIASISKPVTGTAAIRLVDLGKLDLDAPVTRYIQGFQAPAGAEGVKVRQLLNHSAGWLGDDFRDTGSGDDAIAKYVDGIHLLPQLTAPGLVFAYNNAAIITAGRVIEVITGSTFDAAVQNLVLNPLGMTRSAYFLKELGPNVAIPHTIENGKAVAKPESLYVPRNEGPTGGLFSSVTDMLSFARFHLGDGRAANGKRLISKATLGSMWSQPGPGGTLATELKGMGVAWATRPTINGVAIVEHGGDWPGFRPWLTTIPEKQFAMALLTNSDDGAKLRAQLLFGDWVLQRFASVRNLPAFPASLSASELAQYEGVYTATMIDFQGKSQHLELHLVAADGGLNLATPAGLRTTLRFYGYDRVTTPDGARSDFLRAADGNIKWFRYGGRLYSPAT